MKQNEFKVIVIGLNHAGTTAVRTLHRLNKNINMKIVGYDLNDNISFLGCGIALWVSGEVKDPNGLFYASPEILTSEGIEVHMQHEVIAIDNIKKVIRIKDLVTGIEKEDFYDKLIFAGGSWPIIPRKIPNIDADGINIVKTYAHGQKVRKAVQNQDIKNVVVVGAGYIGIELVDALQINQKNVILIDAESRIMPRYYDEEFTSEVEKSMHNTKRVIFKGGESVLSFSKHKNSNSVKSVITDKGEYPADMVIWAVGFRPKTEILDGVVDLRENVKTIITNEYCQTSDQDIYAIGDCIEVYDNAKETKANIALATTAVRTGVLAALNIANEFQNKPLIKSPGFQGANAISVFDWKMSSVGVTEHVAKSMKLDYETIVFEDNALPEFMVHNEKVKLKIIWDKKNRNIIGAQIASKKNHTEVMYMFSLAILKNLKIDELPLLDIFFLPHFNKPYNFVTLAGLEVLGLNYFKSEDK